MQKFSSSSRPLFFLDNITGCLKTKNELNEFIHSMTMTPQYDLLIVEQNKVYSNFTIFDEKVNNF